MTRPAPTVPASRVWVDVADQVEHLRRALVTLHIAVRDAARYAQVSSPHARPLITGRNQTATSRASDALMDLEQTLRNEAARIERTR